MRVLVFGGSGQIGYYLVNSLKQLGYSVYSVSRSNTNVTYCDANYTLDLSLCSIFDIRRLCDLIRPTVIVYLSAVHGAATSSVMNSTDYLYSMDRVNKYVPLELISYCDQNSCKFVFSSSSYAYSPILNTIRYVNEDTLICPSNIYGHQKAHVQSALVHRINDGFNGLNLVLFNNISRLRKPPFLIPNVIAFINLIVSEQHAPHDKLNLRSAQSIFDISCTLDIVYIITQLIASNSVGNFILGSSNVVSVSDIVNICFSFKGLAPAQYVSYDENSFDNVSCVSADNAKILQLFDAFCFKSPEIVLTSLMS